MDGNDHRSILLPSDLSSVRDARRFVNAVLPPGPQEVREAAALCASELVANVVRHTNSPVCKLTVYTDASGTQITVEDASLGSPAVELHAELDEEGRGMQIVQALARAWGVEQSEGDGKAVWVRL